MQFYQPGLNYLFWRQVSSLPDGLHNREPNQASASGTLRSVYPAAPATPHLFVSFVDQPVNTLLDLLVNNVKVASLKVVDLTGLVYAEVYLPHSKGQSTIEVTVRNPATGLAVEFSTFATSNIGLTFETRSAFAAGTDVGIEQVGQDPSIVGVEQALLEDKFGVFTGLGRRNDQTIEEYRIQTECLWRAFQYASMEKGLTDSLRCLLGDVVITIERTRDVVGNRVFDKEQFVPDNDGPGGDVYTAGGTWPVGMKRYDPDTPHYYVADLALDFRTSYAPGGSPVEILAADGLGPNPDFDATNVRSMTIRTTQAIGNEVFVVIDEADAVRSVVDEQVFRRGGTSVDALSNTHVATTVIVTEAVIGGVVEVLPINLPVEGVDFTVEALTGEVTWLGTAKQPDDATIYKVSYSFRLDDAIRVVLRQIKPAQRSIVVLFTNLTSSLPKAIEV